MSASKVQIEKTWVGTFVYVAKSEKSYHVRTIDGDVFIRSFCKFVQLANCRNAERFTGFPHNLLCHLAHNLSDAQYDAIRFAKLCDFIISKTK